MEFSNYYYEMDFNPPQRYDDFIAKKNDVGRGLKVTVVSGHFKQDISNCHMLFLAVKPDGKSVNLTAEKKGTLFFVKFTSQLFTTAGQVECELRLLGARGEDIGSSNFNIIVDKGLAFDVESTDDYSAISGLYSKVAHLEPQYNETKAKIDELGNLIVNEEERQRNEQERKQKEQERQALYDRASTLKLELDKLKAELNNAKTNHAELIKQLDAQVLQLMNNVNLIENAENLRVQAEQAREQLKTQLIALKEEINGKEFTRTEKMQELDAKLQLLNDLNDKLRQADVVKATYDGLETKIREQIRIIEETTENLKKLEAGEIANDVALLKSQKADKTYVDERLTTLIGEAPDTLDTLAELARAVGDNKQLLNVAKTAIAEKASKSELEDLKQDINIRLTTDYLPWSETDNYVKKTDYNNNNTQINNKFKTIEDKLQVRLAYENGQLVAIVEGVQ